MHFKPLLVGLMALVTGAAIAFGQNPGDPPPDRGDGPPGFGGPQGFGPPGFGGRGFNRMGMGPGGPLGILGAPEVQVELKLTEAQKQTVADALARQQDQLQTLMQKSFEGMNDLDEDERAKRFDDMRTQSDTLNRESLEGVLKTLEPPQVGRFEQLRRQREGIDALLRDDAVRMLELSEAQIESLRDVQEQQPGFFRPRAPGLPAEALAVLTDDQKSKWKDLTGPEFKFQEPRGFGPPGGPMGQSRELVAKFDKDGDGRLNREERNAARESIKSDGGPGRGRRGFGPPGGPFGREEEPVKPGPLVAVEEVAPVDAPFYDPGVVRTIFLNFENDDWEAELGDFVRSDVEVPASMTVDGREYPGVGVHLRGMSSLMGVQAGHKRSINVSVDFTDSEQRIQGYKTLNLLNSHEDPSFLHTILYLQAARQYLPALKANFVRVVINGESWGLYVNVQQFNKEYIAEAYPEQPKGTRWKVPGSPGGRGGLEYLGEDLATYKRIYEIKSNDSPKAWKALIHLCKVLNETPADQLEAALEPILDIDQALWFLALENALVNSDGYWVRASDYNIFLDQSGKFHLTPHDTNETFQPGMGPGMGFGPGGPRGGFGGPGGPGGRAGRAEGRPRRPQGEDGPGPGGPPRDGDRPRPEGPPGAGPGGPGGRRGMRGGPGGGGVELDPLVGLNDSSKPLRSKLLAVPSLKRHYLEHVRTIANDWLDWEKLGPVVEQHAALIAPYVEADTRKLSSYAAFQASVSAEPTPPAEGRGRRMSLKEFADQRRVFLLNHPEIKRLE